MLDNAMQRAQVQSLVWFGGNEANAWRQAKKAPLKPSLEDMNALETNLRDSHV